MPPRPVTYSLKLARRLCGRLAAGRSLARVSREPGMPAASTIKDWVNERPEFARMYRAACARRAHAAARARVRDAASPGRPTLYTPELAQKIAGMVAEGMSMRAIAARKDTPSIATMFNWKIDHEDFRRLCLSAWEQYAELVADEIIQVADQALSGGWADPPGRPPVTARDALAHARLKITARVSRVGRLAPRNLSQTSQEADGPQTLEDLLLQWKEEDRLAKLNAPPQPDPPPVGSTWR